MAEKIIIVLRDKVFKFIHNIQILPAALQHSKHNHINYYKNKTFVRETPEYHVKKKKKTIVARAHHNIYTIHNIMVGTNISTYMSYIGICIPPRQTRIIGSFVRAQILLLFCYVGDRDYS